VNDPEAQHSEQAVVELLQRLHGRLFRSPNQVGRYPLFPAFELSLVKQSQPGSKKGNHRRGFMSFRREGCSRTRLVMVFQKASHLALVVEGRAQMIPHRPGMPFAKAIVQPLDKSDAILQAAIELFHLLF
jgi:hypothetical protein